MAGWGLGPGLRAPRAWRVPFDLGFSAELAAPRPAFGGASPTLELTPILERRFGAVRLGLNANVERDLGEGEAGGTSEGWELEPAALLGVPGSSRGLLRAENYGSRGARSRPPGPPPPVRPL